MTSHFGLRPLTVLFSCESYKAVKERAQEIVGALREPQPERLAIALYESDSFLSLLMDAIPIEV